MNETARRLFRLLLLILFFVVVLQLVLWWQKNHDQPAGDAASTPGITVVIPGDETPG